LVDFIKENRDNYVFHIWTSNNRKTLEPVMKDLPVADVFSKIVTKEEVNLLKPSPDGFKVIFDPKKDQLDDFLMIGDSDQDEGAAKNAGIDFFPVVPDFY